ncbi:MAG TPA: energy transducer TonB [Pyrinomonadaceae bacterium]|jgi:TonB family protein
MKRCPTCQEEFADKFGFCPVDGTPLSNGYNATAAESVTAGGAHPAHEESGVYQTAASETTAAGEDTWAAREAQAGADGAATGETVGAAAAAAAAGAAGGGFAGAGREREEYHLTMLEDQGLVRRLTTEVREIGHEAELSWPEFKRNPGGFIKRGASAYGRAGVRFVAQPNVARGIIAAFAGVILLALAVAGFDSLQSRHAVSIRTIVVTMTALALCGAAAALLDRVRAKHTTAVVGIVVALVLMLTAGIGFVAYDNWHGRQLAAADKVREDLEYQGLLTEIPEEQKKPDEGPAGQAKGNGGGSKPKMEKPGGGGGGGRMETKPASFGKLPPASLTVPQVRAPDPHPPTITNPHLPTPATIVADPVLFPTDPRPLPYGDPKSKSTETSSGPGTGNGIGTGTGGGVGSGEGGGVGPGRGGNTGGGDYHEGGGGPGGGGGGTDYSKTFTTKEVTKKAVITAKPEPQFTEEARKNNVTGEVVLRMVLGSNGTVSNIVPVKRLPDGLTEKAIEAARRIQFIPAEKDGRRVSQYVSVVYNFNIY